MKNIGEMSFVSGVDLVLGKLVKCQNISSDL